MERKKRNVNERSKLFFRSTETHCKQNRPLFFIFSGLVLKTFLGVILVQL